MSDADLGGDPPCWAHLFGDEGTPAEGTHDHDRRSLLEDADLAHSLKIHPAQ